MILYYNTPPENNGTGSVGNVFRVKIHSIHTESSVANNSVAGGGFQNLVLLTCMGSG